MKKIYRMSVDFGRIGELNGLFVAEDKQVEYLIGKEIYFGEVLGKHSEIYGELEEDEITVVSDDQDFIKKFIEIMGDGTISGYSPVDYYDPEGEDKEWHNMIKQCLNNFLKGGKIIVSIRD